MIKISAHLRVLCVSAVKASLIFYRRVTEHAEKAQRAYLIDNICYNSLTQKTLPYFPGNNC